MIHIPSLVEAAIRRFPWHFRERLLSEPEELLARVLDEYRRVVRIEVRW